MTGAWWIGEGELDDDQKQVIQLPLEGRFLVTGPAGSGKTNMLLLRANYLYKAGLANLGVVVFTRGLKGFLQSGAHQYSFPQDRIRTFTSFLVRFLLEKGVTYEPSGNFNRDRRFLATETLRILNNSSSSYEYDALLVDESQDYLPHEIELFGRLGRHLFFVADNFQKIYDGEDALAPIGTLVNQSINLNFHYRNGRKICRLADDLMVGSEGYAARAGSSQYNESRRPSSVDFFPNLSLQQQVQSTVTALETQLQTYPGESLAVLCPRREELSTVIELLRSSSIANRCTFSTNDETLQFSDDKPVVVCTAHLAKGLEFTCVHILGAEFFANFREKQKRLAYTAITRAKTSLRIYHENTLPRSLDRARAALAGPPQRPPLNSIFG
jgi:superfamily I DNA/RNA helicase